MSETPETPPLGPNGQPPILTPSEAPPMEVPGGSAQVESLLRTLKNQGETIKQLDEQLEAQAQTIDQRDNEIKQLRGLVDELGNKKGTPISAAPAEAKGPLPPGAAGQLYGKMMEQVSDATQFEEKVRESLGQIPTPDIKTVLDKPGDPVRFVLPSGLAIACSRSMVEAEAKARIAAELEDPK